MYTTSGGRRGSLISTLIKKKVQFSTIIKLENRAETSDLFINNIIVILHCTYTHYLDICHLRAHPPLQTPSTNPPPPHYPQQWCNTSGYANHQNAISNHKVKSSYSSCVICNWALCSSVITWKKINQMTQLIFLLSEGHNLWLLNNRSLTINNNWESVFVNDFCTSGTGEQHTQALLLFFFFLIKPDGIGNII